MINRQGHADYIVIDRTSNEGIKLCKSMRKYLCTQIRDIENLAWLAELIEDYALVEEFYVNLASENILKLSAPDCSILRLLELNVGFVENAFRSLILCETSDQVEIALTLREHF